MWDPLIDVLSLISSIQHDTRCTNQPRISRRSPENLPWSHVGHQNPPFMPGQAVPRESLGTVPN